MRGKKVSKQNRRLDVVVEAVRYDARKNKLALARGYERHGYVWGDRVLFERKTLIDLVESKKNVVAGRPANLEGDFEVFAQIRVASSDGNIALVVEDHVGDGDDLDLPLF